MANKEQKNVTMREFWLNPSVKENGIYQVHANYKCTHSKWDYSRIAPSSLPIVEKIVYAPTFLTEEDKKEIDPKQEINDLIKQIDNYKRCREKAKRRLEEDVVQPKNDNRIRELFKQVEKTLARYDKQIQEKKKQVDFLQENAARIKKDVERIKSTKGHYRYIGDSDPIAKGITAFFIKRTPREDDDYWSFLNLLERDDKFDIYDWYKAYWEEQKTFAERLNRKKTYSLGRLTDEEFYAKFIEDHLIQEQDLLRKSERFFSDDFSYETNDVKRLIRAYVEGYLEWVAKKSKNIIVGYKTDKPRMNLLKLFDCLIEKRFIKESSINRDDFANVFSGRIMRTRVTYGGSKKKLGSIIKKLTGRDVKREEVNQRFTFIGVGDFKRNDIPKKEHTGLKTCYDKVFKNK